MPSRLINAMLGPAVAALVVTGCSDTQSGTPTASAASATDTSASDPTGSATPSDKPGASGSTDRYGAPSVIKPLDATRFLGQPCTALTPPQLHGLNLPAQGKPNTDSAVARHAGPSCGWINSDTATGIGVQFVTGNKNGLADVYRAHGEGKWKAYWEETTIAGYPGVLADESDLRPQGTCNLFVGVSDTLAFGVGVRGRLKEKSCDLAQQVAAAVVATVKGEG